MYNFILRIKQTSFLDKSVFDLHITFNIRYAILLELSAVTQEVAQVLHISLLMLPLPLPFPRYVTIITNCYRLSLTLQNLLLTVSFHLYPRKLTFSTLKQSTCLHITIRLSGRGIGEIQSVSLFLPRFSRKLDSLKSISRTLLPQPLERPLLLRRIKRCVALKHFKSEIIHKIIGVYIVTHLSLQKH
jgi:hypothetical protein